MLRRTAMKSHFIGFHLDFVGFTTSLLCAVHCAALPLLLSLAPLTGLRFLDNPAIEQAVILLSFLFASLAMAQGYRKYHQKTRPLWLVVGGFLLIGSGHYFHSAWGEPVLSSAGGLSIALAHLINWKHIRQSATSCRLPKNRLNP